MVVNFALCVNVLPNDNILLQRGLLQIGMSIIQKMVLRIFR